MGETLGESLFKTRRMLEAAGDEHAEVSAEWLLEWVAGKTRAELHRDAEEPLDLAKRMQLMAATARRCAGEPLQYITGSAPFRRFEIACEPGVLIPRPETELLVELALAALDGRVGAGGSARVLDLCTGTGCIACAIAAEREGAEVWASDVAPEAVALAGRNAEALGVTGRVHMLEGDLAEVVPRSLHGTFDLVVSNPPYVPSRVVDELPAEVRGHEPRLALDGGADGLSVVRRIVRESPKLLAPGGTLALELFEDHVDEACELVESARDAEGGPAFAKVRMERDLAGRPRFLLAERASARAVSDPLELVCEVASGLARGEVAIIPTDSVYGIGCAMGAEGALARIFELKGRERSQALPLVLGDVEDLARYAKDLAPSARRLAERFWPGALTLVVRASSAVPEAFCAADGTVGLRVPDHAFVRALCAALGRPLALTSANLHGEPPARSIEELDPQLKATVDWVVDGGPAPLGVASTVVDATGPHLRILRAGAIREEDLLRAIP